MMDVLFFISLIVGIISFVVLIIKTMRKKDDKKSGGLYLPFVLCSWWGALLYPQMR